MPIIWLFKLFFDNSIKLWPMPNPISKILGVDFFIFFKLNWKFLRFSSRIFFFLTKFYETEFVQRIFFFTTVALKIDELLISCIFGKNSLNPNKPWVGSSERININSWRFNSLLFSKHPNTFSCCNEWCRNDFIGLPRN